MTGRLLSQPKVGRSYRRPTKDRHIRVIWREDGRDRSKAFKWWGPATDHARHVAGCDELIVDLDRELVSEYCWGMTYGERVDWRQPTGAESERIRAMRFTYDSRGRG